MDLMTIGAFAERTRLSPKALRLYDRPGLLPPVRADPVSGYRFYSEDQVADARLVALLRRLGMPLPVIADIAAKRADGTVPEAGKAPHLAAALAHGIGAVPGQVAVDEEPNEIPAARDLLKAFVGLAAVITST